MRSNAIWFVANFLAIAVAYIAFFALYGLSNGFLYAPIAFSILIGEFIAALFLIMLARKLGNRLLFFLASALLIVVCLINASELLSIVKSGNLLDFDALENFEHIGFMVDALSVSVVVFFVGYGVLVIKLSSRFESVSSLAGITPFVLGLLLLIGANNIAAFKYIRYQFPANNQSYTQSLISLFATPKTIKADETHIVLTQSDLEKAKEYGFWIDTDSSFPLERNTTGNAETKFPNIIVIFTESLSAELIGKDEGGGKKLTPNIDKFLSQSLKVTNYYNHAFPTIAGLKGQLCSSLSTAAQSEFSNAVSVPKLANMKCLPHHLNDSGYHTTYMGYSHSGYTFNEQQMKATGFGKTIFLDQILSSYLKGENPALGSHGLGDDQMLGTLEKYLEEIDKSAPFFVAISTIGTHPGLDSKDIVFGNSPVQNVLHRFDHHFGAFFEWFKSRSFERETVLILTADHAHVPSKEYISVASANFVPSRLNPIVFGIFSTSNRYTGAFEANSTSIDFAPTLLSIAGIGSTVNNHFLGSDIFAERNSQKSIGYSRGEILIVNRQDGKAMRAKIDTLPSEKRILGYFKQLENENRFRSD